MIREKFQVQNPQIISYDWADMIQKLGYVTYYLWGGYAGGKQYSLVNNIIEADVNNNIVSRTEDKDFDILFLNPADIKGNALFNFTLTVNNATCNVTITVNHVTAGGVETSLGTATGATVASAGVVSQRQSFYITLTEKHFGIGESLRISVAVNGAASTGYVSIDPASTTGTEFIANIPFKVNA